MSVSCLAEKINSPFKSKPDGGRLKANLMPSLPHNVQFLSGGVVVGGSAVVVVVVGGDRGSGHGTVYNIIFRKLHMLMVIHKTKSTILHLATVIL